MSPSALIPEVAESQIKTLTPTSNPAFQLKEFPASTATKDEVVDALIVDGGCTIRNFVSPSDLATIESDVRPSSTLTSHGHPMTSSPSKQDESAACLENLHHLRTKSLVTSFTVVPAMFCSHLRQKFGLVTIKKLMSQNHKSTIPLSFPLVLEHETRACTEMIWYIITTTLLSK